MCVCVCEYCGRVSLPAAVAKPSYLSSSPFSLDRLHLPNSASGPFPPFLHTRSLSFPFSFALLIFMFFIVMFRISALSLPFRRPRDLQEISEHVTFVSICNICPHKQHFSVLPFVRTCTICLHMQHLTAPAQFYRLRSDFLLPPLAVLQCLCIRDARVQLSVLRWLGTTAGTSSF